MKRLFGLLVFSALFIEGVLVHACTPDPGQCCQDTACSPEQIVLYETKVAVPGSVVVTDQFGVHTFTFDYLRRVGAPTAPASLVNPHATVYGGTDDLPPPGVPLTVQTAAGTITRTVGSRIRYIMTDASKGIPPNAPPPFVPSEIRTCYPFGKAQPNRTVTFTDQFGTHTGVVQESAFLCLPAQAGALQSTTPLLCYAMNVLGPNATVNLIAPFGPSSAKIDHTDNLCIGATVL